MNFNIELFISDKWQDYELIDCGDGERLERWGDIILVRPDPNALWQASSAPEWRKPDAVYHRSTSGGGSWDFKTKLPEHWIMRYGNLSFKVRPTGFKHTGLFPEQAYNWTRTQEIISNNQLPNRNIKVLNLFGYTGAASVAAAKAGADVCHVDSSAGMLSWCKENYKLSGIPDGHVRLIEDDCLKFVEREIKRGNKYDCIIMDPPSFGRGAKGEVWKLENNLLQLLQACREVLSDTPLFILINSYTAGISSVVVANMMYTLKLPIKSLKYGELTLPFRKKDPMLLPCGLTIWAEF